MGKPPARSRITRERDQKTVAFAEARDDKKGGKKKGDKAEPDPVAPHDAAADGDGEPIEVTKAEPEPKDAQSSEPEPQTEPTQSQSPEPEPEPVRARAQTASMEVVSVGAPPAIPAAPPAAPVATGAVEDPTHMPHPRDVPGGSPDDAAAPPGRVPPGDSRSLRNGAQFALIYRLGTFIITRFGAVGTRGQWRVVEYPTSSSASHAYAKESSRFVSEGFSDYRD